MEWLIPAILGLFSAMSNRSSVNQTNAQNKEMFDEQMAYTAQRDKVFDERYADELNYNRNFIAEEQQYQRALQERIFEREDTALERQAQSLANMGINPLSQQMNGLAAGQALPSLSPAHAPSSVSNGLPSAPNLQAPKFNLGDILSSVNSMNNLKTQGLQRDSITQEIARQRLDNEAKAIDNLIKKDKFDITTDENGNLILNKKYDYKDQDFNKVDFQDKNASKNRNVREDIIQERTGQHDNQSNYNAIAGDVSWQAERALTAMEKVGDDISTSLSKSEKKASKLITESISKKYNQAKNYLTNGWKNDKLRFKNFWSKVNDFGNKYLSNNY